MESIRRKIINLINLGSNKFNVVSEIKFFFLILLNYVKLNHLQKKIKMKNAHDKITSILWGLNKGLHGK